MNKTKMIGIGVVLITLINLIPMVNAAQLVFEGFEDDTVGSTAPTNTAYTYSTLNSAGSAVSSNVSHSGVNSFKIISPSTNGISLFQTTTPGLCATGSSFTWFENLPSYPAANTVDVVFFRDSAGTPQFPPSVYINSAGYVHMQDGTDPDYNSSVALSLNTWYDFTVSYFCGVSGSQSPILNLTSASLGITHSYTAFNVISSSRELDFSVAGSSPGVTGGAGNTYYIDDFGASNGVFTNVTTGGFTTGFPPTSIVVDYNHNLSANVFVNDHSTSRGANRLYTEGFNLTGATSTTGCPSYISDLNNLAELVYLASDNVLLYPCATFSTNSVDDQFRDYTTGLGAAGGCTTSGAFGGFATTCTGLQHPGYNYIADGGDAAHICLVDTSNNVTKLLSATNDTIYATYTASQINDCFIDKINQQWIVSSANGLNVFSNTGAALYNVSNATNSGVSYNGNYYGIGSSPVKITKYQVVSGALSPVAQVNDISGVTRQYISPDGQYLFAWQFNSTAFVHLYQTSNMSLLLNITYPSNIIDAKMDVDNNALFAVAFNGNVYKALLSGTTCSTGGCGNATNGTLNPPPVNGTVPTIGNQTGGTSVANQATGSITISPGGSGGGYVSNAPSTFFGLDLAYLATQFGIGLTAIKWLVGIFVVALVVLGLGTKSPIITAVAILLGIGLAVVFGLFPVWLLLIMVLFLVWAVSRLFSGGGDME